MLNTFLVKKVDAVALTDVGYKLSDLLEKKDDESISMYNHLLFWTFLRSEIEHDFQKLIEDRAIARKEKNWEKSDEIRDKLSSYGIIIEDTPQGQVWKLK